MLDDIAKILEIPLPDYENDEEFSREQFVYMNRLHDETKTALQIILHTQSFVPGKYVADDYLKNWELLQ